MVSWGFEPASSPNLKHNPSSWPLPLKHHHHTAFMEIVDKILYKWAFQISEYRVIGNLPIEVSGFSNIPYAKFPAIFMHFFFFAIKCLFTIFNFQDTSVSTNMISNKCMIYHMKVRIVNYDLGPKKCQNPKFIFCLFMNKWTPKWL